MLYKAAIFDLDGTLINSLDDLANTANLVLQKYGFSTYETAAYKKMVGNGIHKLMERALPQGTEKKLIDKAFDEFLAFYAEHQFDYTAPYEGIREMLELLKKRQIKLAICTNKEEKAAQKIVERFFGRDYFFAISGDKPGFLPKPDPKKVLSIAAQMNLSPEEIIYVGDSDVDMKTGLNAKMLPVGVLWGFRSREELLANGAAILLEKPSEMLQKIQFK